MLGEPLEVLDGSGEEEFLAGAGEAPQSEPDHRENVLSLAEEGFDPPALDTGHPIGLGVHQALGIVAGFLMDVTLDPSRPAGGAMRLEWAAGTVAALGDVFDRVASVWRRRFLAPCRRDKYRDRAHGHKRSRPG